MKQYLMPSYGEIMKHALTCKAIGAEVCSSVWCEFVLVKVNMNQLGVILYLNMYVCKFEPIQHVFRQKAFCKESILFHSYTLFYSLQRGQGIFIAINYTHVFSGDPLEFLALRKYTPEQRIRIVEQAINNTPDIGLVIIDGIRDMVYDINSPGESTRIISKLMQWTDDRQIHIHTILHQNKGDENARGHIGTELNNKAETVLLVEKDKSNGDISNVSAMHIRAMDFEPFAFRINDNALPELIEGYRPEAKKPGRPEEEKFDPYRHITEQQHRIALEAAFGLKEEYGYKDLETSLIKAYMSVGVKLNHQKAVSLITMLRNKRMIVQENGRKYTFKPDFHY